MKKIIFVVLFLSGCASFYGLTEDEYKQRSREYREIEKYTTCLSFQEYNDIIDYKCSYNLKAELYSIYVDTDYPKNIGVGFDEFFEKHPCSFYTPEVILETAKIFSKRCPLGSPSRYSDFIEKMDELIIHNAKSVLKEKQKKEEEKREIRKADKMAATEKKYGKKFCSEPMLNVYILRNQTIPSNCLVHSDELVFRASQQIKDGTLVSVAYPQYFRNLLILKNETDSNLISGQNVPAGVFIGQGNYTYTTVLGATATVSKLKRLE